MKNEEKIKKLINTSREVISGCALENGAIVAANSTKPYYHKEAKNYFYVWPRDVSFIGIAADILGLENVQENFFDWLLKRAEGWKETGLFYEKYYPNGLKSEARFQPDQTGSILFAIWHHFKNNPAGAEKYKKLITHSAEGLCEVWKNDHFSIITNDLWEERLTFPDLKDNFSYSLAACIRGLLCANELFPNKKHITTAKKMKEVLLKSSRRTNNFSRLSGRLPDERIDASLLGIIWPFEIVNAKRPIAKNTIALIKKKLVKDLGIYRYEHDEYDGWMFEKDHRKKGAGFWPLLNFWMSIVLNQAGKKKEALQYYERVVDVVDKFIPEQIFNNDIQKSVSPLCWSHAMFIIATKELGLYK